ncbi:MAG TPA: glycosyltransferase family 2 protein [Propionibacteriaceae bacterium]|nr:glycosyltransferase family 2 protein [Propionibacteriaceae bacterium]
MRLSVVVPCYNVEAYAAQTLRSLRGNAADGIEFLFVDDASTDATPGILQAAAAELPGSRILTREVNGGLAATRNVGINAARGEYLTFLDGDDFVAPGYYPKLLATIERLGCDLVRTDHVQVRGRERVVHRINHGPRRVVSSPRRAILPVDQVTSVDAPYAWAGIYHRRLVDSGMLHFSEELRTCEDRPWNWRLHLQARSFAVVGLLGVYYRRDVANSLTRVADERQFDFLPAFDQIVALVQADPEADLLLPKAIRSYCAIVLHHLSQSSRYQPELARRLAWRCRQAIERLPQHSLRQVVSGLDRPRARRINALLEAA